MQQSLTVLVPRVWPFLRHTISSVRRAALQTLFTLLSKADQVSHHYLFLCCCMFSRIPIDNALGLKMYSCLNATKSTLIADSSLDFMCERIRRDLCVYIFRVVQCGSTPSYKTCCGTSSSPAYWRATRTSLSWSKRYAAQSLKTFSLSGLDSLK